MGLFNILRTTAPCPNCSTEQEFAIQFKYGHTRQLEFRLGEQISWLDRDDIGFKNSAKVRVEGVAGPCNTCGSDFLEFDIFVYRDTLKEVVPIKKRGPGNLDGFEILS